MVTKGSPFSMRNENISRSGSGSEDVEKASVRPRVPVPSASPSPRMNSPQNIEALKFTRRLFQEKILDPEFATNNRNVIMQELKSFRDVKCVPPDGTFYCLPDFRAYTPRFGGKSVDLCKFLLDKARVVTVPGKEFGMDGHLRLSYCGTIKEIMDALERIKWALDPQSPNELFLGDRKLVRDWA